MTNIHTHSNKNKGSASTPQSARYTRQAQAQIKLTALSYSAGSPALHSNKPADTQQEKHADSLALRNISLTINPGECLLLTGTSGGGKSSLLRLLNGLIPHYHHAHIDGEIRISCDRETTHRTIAPASEPLWVTGDAVATVFQNPRTQFFTTDVTSELAFALENRAENPDVIRARIAEVAAHAGISALLGRSLFQLSGGERQLVACASAVVQAPALYLFDEPTSNLSPAAIDRFAQFLSQLKKSGATIVIAEHRLYFLHGIIDRAVVIDKTVHADMPADDFFSMNDSDRAHFGLRQLTKPQIAVSTKHIRTIAERPDSPKQAPHTGTHSSQGLVLCNLRLRYGRRRTVWDIPQLAFARGAVTAVTGANGVGKSTLAHAICGLKKPARGTIILDDHHATSKDLLHRTYMVMQDVHRQLFCESVRDEISLGLGAITPTADEERYSSIDAVLERFDLADAAERHPLSLSGGQKQRLVIAAATAMDRDVYIFDEPSSGLDRAHLDAIAHTLRTLADAGKIVILITHDNELLNACADVNYHLVECAR